MSDMLVGCFSSGELNSVKISLYFKVQKAEGVFLINGKDLDTLDSKKKKNVLEKEQQVPTVEVTSEAMAFIG